MKAGHSLKMMTSDVGTFSNIENFSLRVLFVLTCWGPHGTQMEGGRTRMERGSAQIEGGSNEEAQGF